MTDSKKDSFELKIQNKEAGVLYVVSTPIGNLEDITLRALRVIKNVDLIAAENVAHTKGLCEHYAIKTRLTSYNQHNQKVKSDEIVKRLKAGYDVAIVTDAGTPGISDPGVHLINRATEEAIDVTPIPGPSAVIAALSVSGLPMETFVFLGFLPNKRAKRKTALIRLISEHRTMVFFEAPHRLKAMLTDLRDALGDRPMAMLREMTKVFEEVKRGPVSTVLEHLSPDRIKGEFTLVVAGNQDTAPPLSEEVLNKIEALLNEKELGVRDISDKLSKEEGLAYRQVYKECLAKKRVRDGLKRMESANTLKIRNNLGLHARAAGRIVELANQYKSELFLKKDDQEVDGSNILSILTLACPKGTELQARIIGEDAENFMEKLIDLFEKKFGETR